MDRNIHRPLDWYQEAKFGLFLHWGVYSVAGVEASWPIMAPDLSEVMFGTKTRIGEADYTALPARFNPVEFDAQSWIRTAQDAGMRYIVITSKHHDGFCMFDAPGTDYKITKTPYGKDICLELAQACANAGMPLGFYYSPPDMHHPGYRDTRKPITQNWVGEPKRKEWGEYLDYMESHIRKLLTDYGEVSILWFDGLTNHGKYDPPRFHQLIHSLSPHTLINDRLGDDYDFITPEQFIPKAGIPVKTGKPPNGIDPAGDAFFKTVTFLYKVPGVRGLIRKQLQTYQDGTHTLTPILQEPYPSPEHFQPWETCMTMGQTWAYNPQETEWKPPEILVSNLVEVVSRGGNYLLNVGPTDRGTFPPQALERLQYIGTWMDKNGESIYGSTYTPLQGSSWGRATRKGNKIYLHLFDWSSTNKLEITPFPVTAQSVSLLAGGSLEFVQNGQQLEIVLPPPTSASSVAVLVVDFVDPGQEFSKYSPVKETKIAPQRYLKSQVWANAWINSLINGLIAFFSYRSRDQIPYAEAAVDILITVFIISYLVSWIAVGSVRNQLVKGNISRPKQAWKWLKLPKGAGLCALLVSIVCVVVFGGFILDGVIYLIAPGGFTNWAYILFKTLYTGATGALAAGLSILSVLYEGKRS